MMMAARFVLAAIATCIVACSTQITAAPAATETKMNAPLPPQADRSPPLRIEPIVKDGVRYERKIGSASDVQVGGLLAAFDATSGKELWTLIVYDNKRRDDLEGDAQDIFFSSMKFQADGSLLIVDEVGRRYAVDVKKKTVTPIKK